jgi:hypothetical protein
MKIHIISITIISMLLLSQACSFNRSIPQTSNVSDSSSSNEGVNEAIPSEGEVLEYRRAYYLPMQPENLDNIHDPASSQWQLFYGYSNPEAYVYFAVKYDVGIDYLQAFGETRLNAESITYERTAFPSSQPFLDLIDYMGNHPDVFFNHSEFENQEPGDYDQSVGGLEGFNLQVSAWQTTEEGRPIYYIIHKAVMPGEEVPVELRYVLDTIRTEFAEQIAGRPIPRPEGTELQDSD